MSKKVLDALSEESGEIAGYFVAVALDGLRRTAGWDYAVPVLYLILRF